MKISHRVVLADLEFYLCISSNEKLLPNFFTHTRLEQPGMNTAIFSVATNTIQRKLT